MSYLFRTALVLAICAVPATAGARSPRVNQIPYGSNFGCLSCHTSAGGGGILTEFGSDVILALVGGDLLQDRAVDWSQLYAIDSDRDGFTNGEELNDPMGMWRIGDRNPVGGVAFNPGDPSSHPIGSCGDDRVTPPEECDGTNLHDLTCIGLGLDEGVLVCNPDCTFDRSDCGGGPAPDDPDPTPVGDPPATDTPADDSACSTAPSRPTDTAAPLLAALALLTARRR